MENNDKDAWFAPHRWGYGAGMPIAWQGWLMLVLQTAAAAWGVIAFADNEPAQVATILLVILVPLPLMIAKTRGGWRWRWGERD